MKGFRSHLWMKKVENFPGGCVACRAPLPSTPHSLDPRSRGAVPSSGGTFSDGGTGPANTKRYQPKTPSKLYKIKMINNINGISFILLTHPFSPILTHQCCWTCIIVYSKKFIPFLPHLNSCHPFLFPS